MSGAGSQAQTQGSRNPRRRARATEDTGSVRQQPQRKRSKLSRDTFDPPSTNGLVNGDASKNKAVNGHVPSPGPSDRTAFAPPIEMPHRTQPKASSIKSGQKDDGTTTLTSNSKYSIKRLPSLPNLIRNSKSGSFHASRISPDGYALILTRQHALIWDYNTTNTLPPSRSLTLPHPTKSEESIPLGAFVYSGANSDTGLVVVNPINGKISFWESIENADALSLFEQRRNGIEGSCGSLMYGESVINITDAGAAGFVLSFSSGRTAQLLVRDSQSRPSISIHFLRKGNSSTGFFDSIKNVLGAGGWLRSIAAVRTFESTTRGQMEAVLCSEDATLQFWQLNWTGQVALQKEVNARSILPAAANHLFGHDMRAIANHAKIIDFAFISGNSNKCSLLLLVGFGASAKQSFALVAADIDEEASMQRAVLLHSYSPPVLPKSDCKPRICLLRQSSAVVVTFENALTFTELTPRRSTPNENLSQDSGQPREPFQDTVYFREDSNYLSCGAVTEDWDGKPMSYPSAIIFVQDFGLLRVSSKGQSSSDSLVPGGAHISAKSKIEQAVYFGSITSNPLDLTRKSEVDFTLEEVESAALRVSQEILTSYSPFISAIAPSMETHLSQRAQHLETLASYLRRFYPDLSRSTKWNLRWDAEKLAAAREVWTACDSWKRQGQNVMNLLHETVLSIEESLKSSMDAERGENDLVRHFFLRDIPIIGVLLGRIWPQVTEFQKDEHTRDHDKLPEVVIGGTELLLKGLEAAFKFRETYAELYGLEDEVSKDGLLCEQYQGLPEFWTSKPVIWLPMTKQIDHVYEMISFAIQETGLVEEVQPVTHKLIMDLVQLIDLFCKVSEERLSWQEGRGIVKDQEEAIAVRDAYQHHRFEFITSLPHLLVDLADDGMRLAEKYNDLRALVGVIAAKSDSVVDNLQNSTDEKTRIQAAADNKILEHRIGQYFKKYPGAFSQIMYSSMVRGGKLNTLLDQAAYRGQELTAFLRSQSPRVKKCAWINEVLFEKNKFMGAKQLMQVATDRETELWNKKVEVSIAKLALNALEDGAQDNTGLEVTRKAQIDEAAKVRIQEMAYEQVRPTLYDATSGDELKLAMEHFGQRTSSKRLPRLHQLLERAMERLVQRKTMSADQLIDLFSLMSNPKSDEQMDAVDASLSFITGQEMLLALTTLKHTTAQKSTQERELLLKIIWRRCFIRDDWSKLNKTANKTDEDATQDLESTTLFKTLYEGYSQDFWEGPSGIRILFPREVLGAGTKAEELTQRFKSSALSEALEKDMTVEDKELARATEKYQLEDWVTTAKQLAEKKWAEELQKKEQHAQNLGSTTQEVYEDDG